MAIVVYDTKIYQQTAKSTINNHFVNKVSTTFFEKYKSLFLKPLNISDIKSEK